jgi:hypothetical protein
LQCVNLLCGVFIKSDVEIFITYMRKSMCGLMSTVLYYGSKWLKMGMIWQFFSESRPYQIKKRSQPYSRRY